ncbi:AraC-like ligand-binding domain-containing protein [Micromonospora sp. NPDC003241]
MLVLDTGNLPVGERAEAFQATVSANCSSSMASFEDPDAIHARMTVFDFGPAKVFNIEASGTTLRRTPRMSRAETETSIVLAVPLRTDNHLSWAREDRRFGPRDLMLVDLSLPYVYGWQGGGASYALHVDVDRLGVPRDLIHEAARTLPGSPMYDLVRDHVIRMTTQADPLAATAAAAELGAASVELMRALVVSAAAANAISLRALYKLYEEMGQSLEQSIIEQRLLGARADLTASHRRYTSIAALARAWGFSSPSFFSHRFRAAFGLTPRQLAATRPTTRVPEPARSR